MEAGSILCGRYFQRVRPTCSCRLLAASFRSLVKVQLRWLGLHQRTVLIYNLPKTTRRKLWSRGETNRCVLPKFSRLGRESSKLSQLYESSARAEDHWRDHIFSLLFPLFSFFFFGNYLRATEFTLYSSTLAPKFRNLLNDNDELASVNFYDYRYQRESFSKFIKRSRGTRYSPLIRLMFTI